ncbi:MAG TPA: peptidoglycan bridge formation glycyltransferase FemA/FemB family protein [Candidatus Saccharimonadaceae bacterium]|nr:peptidoglycan bridge formation glycyltransferase FemA/FemB family protein [Candidatus Saccharimonadaceae bacterium]
MIEIQRCTDKEKWDEYVLDMGGHPLQLWGWGQVKAAHGWKAERFFSYKDDELVGAAQVLVRRLPAPFSSFSYIPRGPIGDSQYIDDMLHAIAEICKKEHRSVALSIEPNSREFKAPKGWKRSKNSVLPAETILLDLDLSESDLLSAMAKKTRQYIRKSAAEGIEIRRVRTKEALEECLNMYQQTAARAGFNTHSRQYYIDVMQKLGDHSPIFAAYLDDTPIAFLWMAVSAETAFELYGGMNEDGQRLRANYALKWHVIRKAKEWGLSEYDFGGLVVGGVSNFKQGWTDEETVHAGTFDRPLSPLYSLWTSVLPGAKKLLQTLRRRK